MREIKFRVWREYNKEMVYNLHNAFTLFGVLQHPHNFPLMQYIGRKDKNGKEIYEGDFVKDDFGSIAEVKFSNDIGSCGCCYESFIGSGFVMNDLVGECEGEVVGNKYENPELLEKLNERHKQ